MSRPGPGGNGDGIIPACETWEPVRKPADGGTVTATQGNDLGGGRAARAQESQPPTASFSRTELRDLAKAEESAREVLRQCAFLRRNGATDTMRFGLIAIEAWNCWRSAARADRRDAIAQGHYVLHWWLPRGYGGGRG